MTDGYATSQALARAAWSCLSLGSEVVLATLGAEGMPQARTVILRGAWRAEGRVEIHTDADSAKVVELHADPRAALLHWHAADRLQLRLSLRVTVRTGPGVEPDWQAVPAAGRVNYGGHPPPGTPMPSADDYTETVHRARFAVLEGMVDSFEALSLGTRHQRASFDRSDGFAGVWIAP